MDQLTKEEIEALLECLSSFGEYFDDYDLIDSVTKKLQVALQNTSSNSDYTKSKSCANCSNLYQCNDVRKHPEWHCEKHNFA